MAKRNLDMLNSLIQEVQEFYDNWTKRLAISQLNMKGNKNYKPYVDDWSLIGVPGFERRWEVLSELIAL